MLNFAGGLSTYFPYKIYVKVIRKKLKKVLVALGVIFIIISVICDQLSYWIHMKTLHLHCPAVLKL